MNKFIKMLFKRLCMSKESKNKFWNIVFTVIFLTLVILVGIILDNQRDDILNITIFEFILLALATFRLIRLVVYDKVMKWFRELFEDNNKSTLKQVLRDLTQCPWCFGVWATLAIVIIYFIIPGGELLIFILALAGIATVIQILMNLIGWVADNAKDKHLKNKK